MHVINIGAAVYSQDGKHIGKVSKAIVDSRKNTLEFIVVDDSVFKADRLVDEGAILSSNDDEIRISIPAAKFGELPPFVEQELVQLRGDVVAPGMPGREALPLPIDGTAGQWQVVDSGRSEYPNIGGHSIFQSTPVGDIVMRERSSIEETDLAISKGTDVKTADGHKVGTVDELLLDDNNAIIGFVVKKGVLFHQDIRVPMAWVSSITSHAVHLNVTRDAAAGGGTIEEH